MTFRDGSIARHQLPVEAWIQKRAHTLRLNKEPIKVVIDPDHAIPDNDHSNNVWTIDSAPSAEP